MRSADGELRRSGDDLYVAKLSPQKLAALKRQYGGGKALRDAIEDWAFQKIREKGFRV
jgi:hypothetical protein